MRTNVEHSSRPVKPLARNLGSGTTSTTIPLQKNATVMERTTLRHLTPEEIALNEQELTCSDEIDKLETQEASLEHELEQDIDESRRMLAVHTLRILYKALLTQHRELVRIKDAQISSLQRSLRAYGGN